MKGVVVTYVAGHEDLPAVPAWAEGLQHAVLGSALALLLFQLVPVW
jgi:hypothetical protein